jgi:cytosine/uracil/thiamine/allantoin permease
VGSFTALVTVYAVLLGVFSKIIYAIVYQCRHRNLEKRTAYEDLHDSAVYGGFGLTLTETHARLFAYIKTLS